MTGNVQAVELVFLLLLLFVVAFGALARKLQVPYPIVLVIAGGLLGFVPGIPKIALNPDVIFFVILPPLLYSAAWVTSWREFSFNLFSILLLAFGLAGMAQAQSRHNRPNPRLTPGHALNVTADDLCKPGQADLEGKISVRVKGQVYDRYGIGGDLIGYHVDHLIPPKLGGSNSLKNLWPQPLVGEWTNQMKNRLERRLRKLVCHGALDLRIAQQEIATDWIEAYKKYLGAPGQARSKRSRRPRSHDRS